MKRISANGRKTKKCLLICIRTRRFVCVAEMINTLTACHRLYHRATINRLFEHERVDRMASVDGRTLDRVAVVDMDPVAVGTVNLDNRPAFVVRPVLGHPVDRLDLVSSIALYHPACQVYRAELKKGSFSNENSLQLRMCTECDILHLLFSGLVLIVMNWNRILTVVVRRTVSNCCHLVYQIDRHSSLGCRDLWTQVIRGRRLVVGMVIPGILQICIEIYKKP